MRFIVGCGKPVSQKLQKKLLCIRSSLFSQYFRTIEHTALSTMSSIHNQQPVRDDHLNDKTIPEASATQVDDYHIPSPQTMAVQFLILCLAILLHYLRRQRVHILRLKIGLVWGVVPVECLILSGLLGEMALRQLGIQYDWLEMIFGIDI